MFPLSIPPSRTHRLTQPPTHHSRPPLHSLSYPAHSPLHTRKVMVQMKCCPALAGSPPTPGVQRPHSFLSRSSHLNPSCYRLSHLSSTSLTSATYRMIVLRFGLRHPQPNSSVVCSVSLGSQVRTIRTTVASTLPQLYPICPLRI